MRSRVAAIAMPTPGRTLSNRHARGFVRVALTVSLVASPLCVLAEDPVDVGSTWTTDAEEPPDPGTSRPSEPAPPLQRGGLDHAWVALKGGVGAFTDGRLAIFLLPPGKVRVAIEGMAGFLVLSRGYGGGVRMQVEALRGERNAMLISPGLEFWVLPPEPGFFGHDGTLHETVVNADLSWLHRYDSGVGFELGVRVGLITGEDTDGSHLALPDVALISGVRF